MLATVVRTSRAKICFGVFDEVASEIFHELVLPNTSINNSCCFNNLESITVDFFLDVPSLSALEITYALHMFCEYI